MNLERIQNIIKFIEYNYHRAILPDELEDIGCYSYRNLHRVFKNIFNESLGEFQKRLKLENGYKKLIYTNDSITDIAFAVGFESLQAFTKSFKKQFHTSPSLSRLNRIDVFDEYINQFNEKQDLAYELVYLNPLEIYYRSIKANNYDNEEIDTLWDNIDMLYGRQKNVEYYGIIVDQPLITVGKHCRYEACINQNPMNKSFASKSIFGGRYIRYTHHGSYELIENTYRLIYKNWLFDAKFEFDDSPIIEYYERHNFNCSTDTDFITQILIPLRKR